MPHTSEFFFTHRLEANVCWQLDCAPRFQQFLAEVTGSNAALMIRMWETLGYLLTADNNAKKFFVLFGKGDSGKSVFGNLLEALLSEGSVSNLDIFRFGDRFSPAALLGKRLNLCMDLPNRVLHEQAIGMIKMLTGRDTVSVERKYHEVIKVRLECKLVFGTNHALRLASPDEAFRARMVILPFLVPVPHEKRDPYLLEKLLFERDAIVSIALRHYMSLLEKGYHFSGEEEAIVCADLLENPITVEEVIDGFIQQYCEFPEDEVFTPTETLYSAFLQYCGEADWPQPKDTAQFSRLLKKACGESIQLGKRRVNSIPKNGYLGIRLRTLPVNAGD